jgi:enoyl-CoA hydratase/carnithine racemase
MAEAEAASIRIGRDRRAEGMVASITIDNPRRLNALNRTLLRALLEAVESLAAEAELRVVVLTGAGERAFIGGADIGEMATLDASTARDFILYVHRCCAALRALPVPVIARIRGYALGAGLEVAASCDLRVAAEGAVFGMPEVKLGIPSVIEAALLPGLVGWGRTREMLLLGETFSAAEAAAWGLVERVVPAEALDAAVERWIAALLRAAPRAVRLQKRLIRAWEELPLPAAIDAGVDAFASAFETDEPRQAMTAFLEARRDRR